MRKCLIQILKLVPSEKQVVTYITYFLRQRICSKKGKYMFFRFHSKQTFIHHLFTPAFMRLIVVFWWVRNWLKLFLKITHCIYRRKGKKKKKEAFANGIIQKRRGFENKSLGKISVCARFSLFFLFCKFFFPNTKSTGKGEIYSVVFFPALYGLYSWLVQSINPLNFIGYIDRILTCFLPEGRSCCCCYYYIKKNLSCFVLCP